MTQEQRNYAIVKMNELANKVMGKSIAYIAIAGILSAILVAVVTPEWWIWGLLAGLLIVTLREFGHICFIVQVKSTLSYLKKNEAECYAAPIYRFDSSITNFMNKRLFRNDDLAYYKFAGDTQKMYIYKVPSSPDGNYYALVFTDEKTNKVFGIQGTCMPDLQDAFKDKRYVDNQPQKKVSVNKWGDETAVEVKSNQSKKKKHKTELRVAMSILIILIIGIAIGLGITFGTKAIKEAKLEAELNTVNFSNTEGKDSEDIDILRNIIIAQQKDRGSINSEINLNLNSNQYRWEDGNLVGIYWSEMYLQGTVDVSGLDQLEVLDLHDTIISEIKFGGNDSLETVDLSENHAIDLLDFAEECPSLKVLNCNNNSLSSGLNIKGCPELEELLCEDAGLNAIDITGNVNLVKCDCSDNNIAKLDLSQNVNLEYLDCSNNRIRRLGVRRNVKLDELITIGNYQIEIEGASK